MEKKAENESMEIVLTVILVSVIGIIIAVAGMTLLKAPDRSSTEGTSVPTATPAVVDSGTSPVQPGSTAAAATPPMEASPSAVQTPAGAAPSVDFTADKTDGAAPLTVQFTDRSSGSLTTWSWDFGDGSKSDRQNPSHAYVDPGTYTVALSATNEFGTAKEVKTAYITAFAPFTDPNAVTPVIECVRNNGDGTYTAYFGYRNDLPIAVAIPVGENNTFVQGSANRGQPTTFQPGINLKAVSVSFEQQEISWKIGGKVASGFPGSNPCPVPPTAKFHVYPQIGKAPLQVFFTDDSPGSPTGWSWSFGTGDTSAEENPSYLYLKPGTYTVTMTVKNAHGEDTLFKTDLIRVTE